jgi:phosphopentomutase
MINRIIVLVIDGLGIGPLPDAEAYGDTDANTVVHVAEAAGGLNLPNLEALGLGHLTAIKGVRTMAQPNGCFGRLAFASQGKDSVIGYWEASGVILRAGEGLYGAGVTSDHVAALEQTFGRKMVGNRVGSLRPMLAQYGSEHLAAGTPILWTDGQNTCHVAVHERILPPAELQQRCRDARKGMKSSRAPIRIVAHPFQGEVGSFKVVAGRKDLIAEPPSLTMLDVLNRSSQIIMGVGKVYDLFSGRGLTRSFPAASADAAFQETLGMLNKVPRGLLYVSLDLMPEDIGEAATALQEFDRRLPDLFDKLRVGDLVLLTSDHGRDLSKPHKIPTREYVPVLATGPKLARGVNLGTRATAADLGQTIVDALCAERLPVGESFFEALRPG